MAKVKDFPIKGFGSKLMIAGKSINNLPDQFLSYSRNARIYDGGIGPRKGKVLLTDSIIGSNNKGGFMMGGILYQIANSKVYSVDMESGIQTEKANLGYDAMTDILVYSFNVESWASLGSQSVGYTYSKPVNKIKFNYALQSIQLYAPDDSFIDNVPVSPANTGFFKPNVKIMNTTTNYEAGGTGTPSTDGYILQDGQFIYLFPAGVPVVANVAARNALFPSPVSGNRVYRLDVSLFDYYDGSSWATQTVGLSGTNVFQSGYYSVANSAKALIGSIGQQVQVFDGTSLSIPLNQPGYNSGILEYCRNYSFLASGNILYISLPITIANPENAYNFTGVGSQQISYDTTIRGLLSTQNGLYVFTEDKVEFIGANALQNVAGSATFISTPIGKSMYPISNLAIAASGDKIFYITKSLQIQTINFTPGVATAEIGELSARPIIGIKEFLDTISLNQPNAFCFYNENDKTIQFNIRSNESGYNDYTLVYDLVNDTWNPDTAKNYNYVVKNGYDYYGFSDVNTSIYKDDTGYSDAGSAIEFRIKTNNLNQGTILQKKYRGFYAAGGIGNQTDLEFRVNIDLETVFQETISGETLIPDVGEIGGSAIGDDPIGGGLYYIPKLNPFDRVADEGRIFQDGKRIQIEILCSSQISDFILDMLGVTAEYTGFTSISDKF